MGRKNELPALIANALGVPAPVGKSNWVAKGDTVEVPWHRAIGEALDIPYETPKGGHMRSMLERYGVEWDGLRHRGVGTGDNVKVEAYEDLYRAIRQSPETARRRTIFETAPGYDDTKVVVDSEEDRRVLRAIRARRGQAAFREQLLEAYEGHCVVTGSTVVDVLEAAHIHPFSAQGAAVVQNGLLLRADIHTLFDLLLIAVETPSRRVVIHDSLRASEYESLEGKVLRAPRRRSLQPSEAALKAHRDRARI